MRSDQIFNFKIKAQSRSSIIGHLIWNLSSLFGSYKSQL